MSAGAASRIWITGIGVVSPLGRGAAITMDRLLAGDRAIAPLALFDVGRPGLVAEVPGFRVEDVAPHGEVDGWSRTDAMAVLAAREAIAHAGLGAGVAHVDLIAGGSTAGMFESEITLAEISRRPEAITPLGAMVAHPLSATADRIASAGGVALRRTRTLCSACSSGANAILLAAAWIRLGRSRCVIAGGADGLCRLTYTGFGALAALDPAPCRPFDRRRAGLNLGEGAAFLVLEPEDAARARGARPIAELRGFAVGAEAHHITNPEADGETAARVMGEALRRAGLTPRDLDYVNAHGTATPLNDAMEAAALARCLGPEVERIAVSSSKGQIGHTLAAAGAIEAAITAMAIARGALPPTIGLEEVDPACRLAHVVASRPLRVRAAMSNSFGFGGTDAVLIFADPDAFPPPPAAEARRVVVTGGATVGPLGVLGAAGTLAYLAPGPAPAPGPIGVQPAEHLDVARARRLDRAARLTTVAVTAARADGGLDPAAPGAGAIGGAAFGSVDGTTAFLRRVQDRGAKFASPADFPNLVPSSPIGHASIYAGLRGPVLAVAELDATAEAAIATAIELLAAGFGEAIVAGSTEEGSALIERCLAPICSDVTARGPRSEGASALLLEDAAHATGRARAEVLWWATWRGDGTGALAEAPVPGPRAGVLVARDDERIARVLAGSPWIAVPRRGLAGRAGDHEGAGGFAAVAALASIAAGELGAVLVVGLARDRGAAILLGAPG